ncbi:hypothetical protein MLC59_14215, partial [Marinobacter bryozoorum]|uniref:hypothetical protein n=1 Tax=Marinobacter bryozoorum TaxID=256324 RepID=UPI002005EEE3
WIVSVTSILAHRDADLEWGGDHPISKEHEKMITDNVIFGFPISWVSWISWQTLFLVFLRTLPLTLSLSKGRGFRG